MKTIPALLSTAAIAAVFYLGYGINQAARTAQSATAVIAGVTSGLPSLAGATAKEAVKSAAHQAEAEIVGAPVEIPKIVLNNVTATGKKAGKDIAAEAKRTRKHVATFANRISGGLL